jgi:aspartate/methionine/tyrosine aminotransferase
MSANVIDQIDSPISTAYALLPLRDGNRELLDLAQAAPTYPAAPSVIEHIVAVARHPHGGDYVEVPGLPVLRQSFAAELSHDYGGRVGEQQVLITAGCNQAFCLVASTLAEPGDEIILPLPFYFNHDMWLRLAHISPVYAEPGPHLVPTPDAVRALITPRTRAILLVSPGNPSGVTAAPETIAAYARIARQHQIALILDETYRSFRGTDAPAHALFAEPGWDDTLVSLHSFSKDFAIPGYRVGAVVSSPALLTEVMKLLDCVAVSAPRIGQEAALAGLTTARPWRAARARELVRKRDWFTAAMARRPGGFELVSAGGFFGWVRHPFAGRPTEDVVRDLVVCRDMLVIPGTAFLPDDRAMLRVSFGNLDRGQIADFAARLDDLCHGLSCGRLRWRQGSPGRCG